MMILMHERAGEHHKTVAHSFRVQEPTKKIEVIDNAYVQIERGCHRQNDSDLPSRHTIVVRELLPPSRSRIENVRCVERIFQTKIAHMRGWQVPTWISTMLPFRSDEEHLIIYLYLPASHESNRTHRTWSWSWPMWITKHPLNPGYGGAPTTRK